MSALAKIHQPHESKWYAVPPYRNEGWSIVNAAGELVATFETREDCEAAVEAYNARVEQ